MRALDLVKQLVKPEPVTQTGKILKLLQKKQHVTNLELNRICFRYGARIHELRDQYQIECEYIKPGVFEYTYFGPIDEL